MIKRVNANLDLIALIFSVRSEAKLSTDGKIGDEMLGGIIREICHLKK